MPTISQDLLDRCLALSALQSDLDAVERLLDAGARDPQSLALFNLLSPPSTRQGDDEKRLAAIGALMPLADPNSKDPRRSQGILARAASCGWVEAFELLAPWAAPDLRDGSGDHVAHLLLSRLDGELDACQTQPMLDALARVAPDLAPQARQELGLIEAARQRDVHKIAHLLDQGANPRSFCGGWTPFLIALGAGQLEAAQLLLSREPRCALDVDEQGLGAVAMAALSKSAPCLELALSIADPNLKDRDGDLPLSLALNHGRWEPILTLARACDPRARNAQGEGPMHWLAQTLLDLDLNVPEDCPLERVVHFFDGAENQLAFVRDLPEIFNLFARDPDALRPNHQGQTPMDLAQKYQGHPAIGAWIQNALRREIAERERLDIGQAASLAARKPKPSL